MNVTVQMLLQAKTKTKQVLAMTFGKAWAGLLKAEEFLLPLNNHFSPVQLEFSHEIMKQGSFKKHVLL